MKFAIPYILVLVTGFTSCLPRGRKNVNSADIDIYSASVTFKDSIHDFGTLSGDSLIQTYDFVYINTGEVPAVILNAVPSCKCTSAEYSKEPVMPKDSGKITVIYDGTTDNSGYFNKSVKVRFNSSQIYNLKIQGRCLSSFS